MPGGEIKQSIFLIEHRETKLRLEMDWRGNSWWIPAPFDTDTVFETKEAAMSAAKKLGLTNKHYKIKQYDKEKYS